MARHRPCLTAVFEGSYSDAFTVCGTLHTEIPFGFGHSAGSGRAERAVFVIAEPLRVFKVRFWMRGSERRAPKRLLRLKSLSRYQSRKTGLAPFKYYVLAITGHRCPARIVAYDRRGRIIDVSERYPKCV